MSLILSIVLLLNIKKSNKKDYGQICMKYIQSPIEV
jgi:hypothetical protein